MKFMRPKSTPPTRLSQFYPPQSSVRQFPTKRRIPLWLFVLIMILVATSIAGFFWGKKVGISEQQSIRGGLSPTQEGRPTVPFVHSPLSTQTPTVQQWSTPTPVVTPSPLASSLCMDTEYVAQYYSLGSAYPPQAMDWFKWLRTQGWTPDGTATPADIVVINANKQGIGPDGYVGVIQKVTPTGPKVWTMVVRSTTGLSSGIPVADSHCNNVADFTFTNLSANYGDGVAFFYK